MTKRVRIEDADTSRHQVMVEVWSATSETKISETPLSGPCDLKDFWVHSGQYLVIRETLFPPNA